MFVCDLAQLGDLHYGGKAESLGRLIKWGLPVPKGYAVAAEAFEDGKLKSEAEKELKELAEKLDRRYTYAVRSSAVGEDGAVDSFAGAYDTVLDVRAEDILKAVAETAASASGERAAVYARERRTSCGNIAVVIQRFVRPDYAGVLFTADAVTAGAEFMTGNYVRGQGEALVSGDAFDGQFRINAVKYAFEGGSQLEKYGKRLCAYAKKAVSGAGCHQDLEWAVCGNKVWILQARPITSIFRNNYESFDINDSLCAELLLSKTNVGEIFLRPVSPVTYGVIRKISDWLGIPLISDVCGQLYLNISGLCSLIVSFGVPREKAFKMIAELAGGIPEGTEIPLYPFDRKAFLEKIWGLIAGRNAKGIPDGNFGKNFKDRIVQAGNEIIGEIRAAESEKELDGIWRRRCEPYMVKTLSAIATGLSLKSLFATREKLEKLCGSELADTLLSDSSSDGSIESLGMLLALDDAANGRITHEEYVSRYGHRHADEMELALPYPYESPDFPENAIQEYVSSGISAYGLKEAQEKRRKEAEIEFARLYPSRKGWLDRVLKKYSTAVYKREKVRSDALRLFCVIREYLLKAGSLTGLGDDIFMLYLEEVKRLLSGDETVKDHISARRENYLKQMAMPRFPSVICGRFTLDEWQSCGGAAGFYRYGESCSDGDGSVVKGVAGACGQAEGIVRVLGSVDEADSFKAGEILVVPAANIGWVKLFPKAAALVTDIGAPLSHAVIVARELGIPAAVSCRCASAVLKTGDRVRVDGTLGTVTLLER